MKKLLLWIVAVAVCVSATIVIAGSAASRRAASREWPAGLGGLAEVPKRFPVTRQSPAATRVVQLASAAAIDVAPMMKDSPRKPAPDKAERDALNAYLKTQLERSGDAIEAPPAKVAQYVASKDAAMSAVRDQLISGQPVVWEADIVKGFDAPIPNLVGNMALQRLLIVRALDKARANDPAAWNELRASWELNRALWQRADLLSHLIALATTRMSTAAARKLPLPAPQWFEEQLSFDVMATLARAYQAEAFVWNAHGTELATRVNVAFRPIYQIGASMDIERMRKYSEELMRVQACDINSDQLKVARASMVARERLFLSDMLAMPNLISAWERALRYRAEVEATERVLQLRAGQTPSPASRCSDGAWAVTANSLKFNRDVRVPGPGIRFPLEYAR